jgi:hypothetical protein
MYLIYSFTSLICTVVICPVGHPYLTNEVPRLVWWNQIAGWIHNLEGFLDKDIIDLDYI